MTQPKQEAREVLARCALRLNSPSAPGQRYTAILTEDLRMLLAFAARPTAGIDREAVARELAGHLSSGVTGTGGGDMDDCDHFYSKHPMHRQVYFEAADAILALLPAAAKTGERGAVIEECARVARGPLPIDVHEESPLYGMGRPRTDFDRGVARGREQAAAAIRALSQPLPDAPIVSGEG